MDDSSKGLHVPALGESLHAGLHDGASMHACILVRPGALLSPPPTADSPPATHSHAGATSLMTSIHSYNLAPPACKLCSLFTL